MPDPASPNASTAEQPTIRSAVHFVGFRTEARFWAAMRVWGPPDFIHSRWDKWAFDDVAPGDTVIFAKGAHDQTPAVRVPRSGPRQQP